MSVDEVLKGVNRACPFLNINTYKSNNNNKDYYIKIIKMILFQKENQSLRIKREIKFDNLEAEHLEEHLYYNIWLANPNIKYSKDLIKILLMFSILTKLIKLKMYLGKFGHIL